MKPKKRVNKGTEDMTNKQILHMNYEVQSFNFMKRSFKKYSRYSICSFIINFLSQYRKIMKWVKILATGVLIFVN